MFSSELQKSYRIFYNHKTLLKSAFPNVVNGKTFFTPLMSGLMIIPFVCHEWMWSNDNFVRLP